MRNQTQKIQSVLYIGLLLSTLTLTIGCQDQGGSGSFQTRFTTDQSWTTVQFPDPNDNGGDSIEIVTEDFLNQRLTGQLSRIEISFEGQSLLVNVWDDEALSTGYPKMLNFGFQQGFTFVTVERQVTYGNQNTNLYLIQGQEIQAGHYRFRLEFENFELNMHGSGYYGLLGYVDLPVCRVDGSC